MHPAFSSPGTPNMMSLQQAWKVLGVHPSTPRGEVKKAFRRKIREVHPDVTGDDGTKLRKVQDAYATVESLTNPEMWDAKGVEEGLPSWASGLLQGVQWSKDCTSYADFLAKPDQKALAVGELDLKTGIRPWAACWGKYSQEEANKEAMRVCRQHGTLCRLVYVGSGTARQRQAPDVSAASAERKWWNDQFKGGGDIPGFGWIPLIDPDKEIVVGYKTVEDIDRFGHGTSRVRVPVFKTKEGHGVPYYYSPVRPKEKVSLKKGTFKRIQRINRRKIKHDPRYKEFQAATSQNSAW